MKKLIALFLAVLMCVSLVACGDDAEPGESQSAQNPGGSTNGSNENGSGETTTQGTESTPNTTDPATPGIELSNDPADFTVSIDGIVYQLGDSMETLLNDGWIPKSGYVLEDDYSIPAGEKRGVVIYQENNKNNAITSGRIVPEQKQACAVMASSLDLQVKPTVPQKSCWLAD